MNERHFQTISAGSHPVLHVLTNEAGSVILRDAEDSTKQITIMGSMIPVLCDVIRKAAAAT